MFDVCGATGPGDGYVIAIAEPHKGMRLADVMRRVNQVDGLEKKCGPFRKARRIKGD
jgi:hypothetical protein